MKEENFIWHIVMNNEKEYDVQTNNNNVTDFVKELTKPNSFHDYRLFKTINNRNTVIIRGDDVSSVEYCINYNN